MSMDDISKVVDIGKQIQKLLTQCSRLSWVQFATGFDLGINAATEKLVQALKNKKDYHTILRYKEKNLSPLDRRRIDILARMFKPCHLSEDLSKLILEMQKRTDQLAQTLSTFRFTLSGREVRMTDIDRILRSEPDRELRKKALLATAQVNKVLIKDGFLDVIKLRNECARLYGAKNFVEFKLEYEELDSSIFNDWIKDTRKFLQRAETFTSEYGIQYLSDPDVMPWDVAFLETQIAPQMAEYVDMTKYYEVLRDTFCGLGFDITKYNLTYDIFPRKNKTEWGYNFTIQDGVDSRVIANVENKYHYYQVLLHETGHALHALSLDPGDILLNLGISAIVRESFARVCDSLLYEESFYSRIFKRTLLRTKKNFARIKKLNKIYCIRRMHAMFFDQALYQENLSSLHDINALYWRKRKSILNEEPYTDNPPWGYVIHYSTHPIYLHNYLLAEITHDMLRSCFAQKHGISNPFDKSIDFGQFLKSELLEPSGAYTFQQLFEKISGGQFSLKYLAEDF
jgi:oligoendopeptidase F